MGCQDNITARTWDCALIEEDDLQDYAAKRARKLVGDSPNMLANARVKAAGDW